MTMELTFEREILRNQKGGGVAKNEKVGSMRFSKSVKQVPKKWHLHAPNRTSAKALVNQTSAKAARPKSVSS